MTTIIKHGFLAPSYNSWSLWTASGNQTITNPGTSHRALETLAYAIDELGKDGWQVKDIFVDQGTPNLILLERKEELV